GLVAVEGSKRVFTRAPHRVVKAAVGQDVIRRGAGRRVGRRKLGSRQKRAGFASGSQARVDNLGIAMHSPFLNPEEGVLRGQGLRGSKAAANGYASDEGSCESARAS